jgi:hypothetical protein
MDSFTGNTTGKEVATAFVKDVATKTDEPLTFVQEVVLSAAYPKNGSHHWGQQRQLVCQGSQNAS